MIRKDCPCDKAILAIIYTNCLRNKYNLALPLAAGASGSAQLGGKLHFLARHAGADAAPVGFGDAPGDGQPDATAAGAFCVLCFFIFIQCIELL